VFLNLRPIDFAVATTQNVFRELAASIKEERRLASESRQSHASLEHSDRVTLRVHE
jgi:hypothetical protein